MFFSSHLDFCCDQIKMMIIAKPFPVFFGLLSDKMVYVVERISIYATKASDKVYHQFTEPKLSPSPFQFTFGSSVAFLCRARLNIPQRLRCLTAGQRCLSDPGYGATDNWYARQCILNHKNIFNHKKTPIQKMAEFWIGLLLIQFSWRSPHLVL